ncbi:hypothetical protein ACROYT_G026054 [Oculina patagonica]
MIESLQQMLPLESLAHPAAVASLLILVVLFLYWWGTRGFADLKKLNVPSCPKPIPFLGNFLEVRKYNGLHLMYFDYVKKYGKVFAICLGSDNWKRIRNILTPTFSAGKMKLMVPLIEKSCDTLVEKLNKIADSGQSVDMLDWFSQLTFEVILATAFGVDANIQMGENAELLEKALAQFKIPLIVRQLGRLPFGTFFFRLLGAIFGNQPSYFLGIVEEIIKTRRQHGLTGRKDLLHLMMAANDETTVEGVSKLSDDEIVAQTVIFLLAGFETSSNTLGFTLYFLALNPHVQDKLRTEIKEAMESSADIPLSEMAHNIEYLDCVIKESQRLCPPGAQTNRECSEDYDLNGIHIAAGTEIIIPIYALHHDPDAWQDPEKFDPERFRAPAQDTRHAFQFLPFGAGPRKCIGMRFALMEVKMALVKILIKYKFVQSPETQVPLAIHPGGTLSAKDGVNVRVESVD